MMLRVTGCSSDENIIMSVNENQGTIDYYGIQVPYVPLEDKDMPEWLNLKVSWYLTKFL